MGEMSGRIGMYVLPHIVCLKEAIIVLWNSIQILQSVILSYSNQPGSVEEPVCGVQSRGSLYGTLSRVCIVRIVL